MKEIYEGKVTFGDIKLIQMLNAKKEKDPFKCKVSISKKILEQNGYSPEEALDLIKKIIAYNKK